MTIFTTVPDSVLEPGDPIRSVDIIAIKNNTNFLNEKHTTNVQTFNSSGTWAKPTLSGTGVGTMARIQVWAGGGGAGRGNANTNQTGGGGGGYNEVVVPLSTLGATVTVTIGAGGTGRTGSNGNGTAGGQTSFGSHCTAFGGGGGAGSTASRFRSGGGGGQLSAGQTGDVGGLIEPGRPFTSFFDGNASSLSTNSFHGGQSESPNFGDALWGGGAGSRGALANAGISVNGGNGGAQNTAGTQPGGGGGASSSANGNGANGAAGRVVITVF